MLGQAAHEFYNNKKYANGQLSLIHTAVIITLKKDVKRSARFWINACSEKQICLSASYGSSMLIIQDWTVISF